jgi:hypothetical protein
VRETLEGLEEERQRHLEKQATKQQQPATAKAPRKKRRE